MNRLDDQFMNGQFTWFMGVVEDIYDTFELNRVKVRCFGFHTEDKGKVKTADLPWATVMMPTTSASVSGKGTNHGLLQGSWVIGFFRDGPSAQDPIVIGSVASSFDDGKPNPNFGFSDPNEQWPVEQQDGSFNDTNFRARGIAEDPARVVDEVIQEPESPYNASYPNNQVTETRSGHVIELDDTPSWERIRVKHRTGTFVEIHPNGDVVMAHNNGWRIVTGDDSLHVTGNSTIFVDGDAFVTIGGNSITNVGGNAELYVDGDATTQIQGNANLSVTGNASALVIGETDIMLEQDAFITVAGTTTVDCPTTNWTGNINLTGDLNITGTSTASGDHVSGGISGRTHTHIDSGGLGAGTTSPPQ